MTDIFPKQPDVGEIFVYALPDDDCRPQRYHSCEIAFVWDGLTWNRDDAVTEQVREARK